MSADNKWHYMVCCGNIQLHGSGGKAVPARLGCSGNAAAHQRTEGYDPRTKNPRRLSPSTSRMPSLNQSGLTIQYQPQQSAPSPTQDILPRKKIPVVLSDTQKVRIHLAEVRVSINRKLKACQPKSRAVRPTHNTSWRSGEYVANPISTTTRALRVEQRSNKKALIQCWSG